MNYNDKFNQYQMEQIRIGFECKLMNEQISMYANPKFDSGQMRTIRVDFEAGMSVSDVKEKYNIETKEEYERSR